MQLKIDEKLINHCTRCPFEPDINLNPYNSQKVTVRKSEVCKVITTLLKFTQTTCQFQKNMKLINIMCIYFSVLLLYRIVYILYFYFFCMLQYF